MSAQSVVLAEVVMMRNSSTWLPCVSVEGEAIEKGRDVHVVKIKEASRTVALNLCLLHFLHR